MVAPACARSASPQRRPPHEGEARVTCALISVRVASPSTKASPRRGGETSRSAAMTWAEGPSTKASPRRGGERTCPSPPTRRWPPSTKASPRRGGERGLPGAGVQGGGALNEGLPTKGRRATLCGDAPLSFAPSTKASPRRGGERPARAGPHLGRDPSTKASPRRGGELGRPLPGLLWILRPQRRPPHEGEARAAISSLSTSRSRDPQRRPPHEGEARCWSISGRVRSCPLNEGLPTKGRRGRTILWDDAMRRLPQRRPPHEGEARGIAR
ncbi:Uncharacterised protein [Mycobacteroides abscessus subsp. abscessus]|nr:Uncharacterised protein [Mycobacteroides abscessus subsp. abscessus]